MEQHYAPHGYNHVPPQPLQHAQHQPHHHATPSLHAPHPHNPHPHPHHQQQQPHLVSHHQHHSHHHHHVPVSAHHSGAGTYAEAAAYGLGHGEAAHMGAYSPPLPASPNHADPVHAASHVGHGGPHAHAMHHGGPHCAPAAPVRLSKGPHMLLLASLRRRAVGTGGSVGMVTAASMGSLGPATPFSPQTPKTPYSLSECASVRSLRSVAAAVPEWGTFRPPATPLRATPRAADACSEKAMGMPHVGSTGFISGSATPHVSADVTSARDATAPADQVLAPSANAWRPKVKAASTATAAAAVATAATEAATAAAATKTTEAETEASTGVEGEVAPAADEGPAARLPPAYSVEGYLLRHAPLATHRNLRDLSALLAPAAAASSSGVIAYTMATLHGLRNSVDRCPPKARIFLLETIYGDSTRIALQLMTPASSPMASPSPQASAVFSASGSVSSPVASGAASTGQLLPPLFLSCPELAPLQTLFQQLAAQGEVPGYTDCRDMLFSSHTTRQRPQRELHNKVMSILSRVTEEKYAELERELLELPGILAADEPTMEKIVDVFFNKAVQDEGFSNLYAKMVSSILERSAHATAPPTASAADAKWAANVADRTSVLAHTLRAALLARCAREFNRPLRLIEPDDTYGSDGRRMDLDDLRARFDTLRQQLRGNLKFVGELYKKGLVTDEAVEGVLQSLLYRAGEMNAEEPFDYAVPVGSTAAASANDHIMEGFVSFMLAIGDLLRVRRPKAFGQFVHFAEEQSKEHRTNRIRLRLMNVCDLARVPHQPQVIVASHAAAVPMSPVTMRSISEASLGGGARPPPPAYNTAVLNRTGSLKSLPASPVSNAPPSPSNYSAAAHSSRALGAGANAPSAPAPAAAGTNRRTLGHAPSVASTSDLLSPVQPISPPSPPPPAAPPVPVSPSVSPAVAPVAAPVALRVDARAGLSMPIALWAAFALPQQIAVMSALPSDPSCTLRADEAAQLGVGLRSLIHWGRAADPETLSDIEASLLQWLVMAADRNSDGVPKSYLSLREAIEQLSQNIAAAETPGKVKLAIANAIISFNKQLAEPAWLVIFTTLMPAAAKDANLTFVVDGTTPLKPLVSEKDLLDVMKILLKSGGQESKNWADNIVKIARASRASTLRIANIGGPDSDFAVALDRAANHVAKFFAAVSDGVGV